jgi:hypothetical protein
MSVSQCRRYAAMRICATSALILPLPAGGEREGIKEIHSLAL